MDSHINRPNSKQSTPTTNNDRKTFGNQAEQFVATHLESQGYNILERNYRQRFGEIDIIAQKGERIAFIEVKARKTNYFNLSQVVGYSKQQKIIKTAQYYCAKQQIVEKVIRFDVALVINNNDIVKLTYIPNAFS